VCEVLCATAFTLPSLGLFADPRVSGPENTAFGIQRDTRHDHRVSTDDERPFEADGWGIQRHWVDSHKRQAVVPDGTIQRLRDVIGRPPDDLEERAPIITRPGRDLRLGRVEVDCEDGRTLVVEGALPHDFPLGYHQLRTTVGTSRRLIVSPGRCWLPAGWRAWGWTVQLYAARSRRSWGIGDLRDLRTLREWSSQLEAGFILVNPLHAVAPTLPQEPSPYLPATRRFRNPLYICVEDVPGAERVDLEDLAQRARPSSSDALIDRDGVWTQKKDALLQVFGTVDLDPGFEAWRFELGDSLQNFAVWSVLAEAHGPDWREWPQTLQHPGGDAVHAVAAEQAERVTFYAWLQWVLDVQLRKASGDLKVIQDQPIGVDGGGADAWVWQDTIARGVRIGAPPDFFNAAGQD
jgi:4-alpha-glucanotransferase